MYKIRALIVYIHTHQKRGRGMVSITNVATPRKAGGSQPATRRSQETYKTKQPPSNHGSTKAQPQPQQASNASVQVYFLSEPL